MMPENSNKFNGDDHTSKPEATANNDRVQDISNLDAGSENANETERIQEASRAAVPPYQIDEDNDLRLNQDTENRANPREENEPATTQGTEGEIEENLSGTTNLSLDQLRKEGDPGGHPLEGQ